MKVQEIGRAIDELAPLKLALDWDNVGLLIGDARKDVESILMTIDITKDVLAEARKLKCDMIFSYHPIIWDGLKKITAEGPTEVVYELIRAGMPVFSIHTALDIAHGGVNDGLAEILGIVDAEPIGDYVDNPAPENYKVVIFTPIEALAQVSNAMFAAGAGAIGNYSHCGFGTAGVGTFKPLEGAKPAIGKKGKLERVEEVRFESIVPAGKLQAVVKAMLEAHPYEIPAYDCFRIHDTGAKFGLGRIGKLAEPLSMERVIEKIKRATGAKAFGIIGQEKRIVRKAAVCAGSCGKLINSVIAAGADFYLTGELKHHQALAAREAGLTCICLSHSVSERFILKIFARRLQKELKQVKITVSRKDADPFRWKEL